MKPLTHVALRLVYLVMLMITAACGVRSSHRDQKDQPSLVTVDERLIFQPATEDTDAEQNMRKSSPSELIFNYQLEAADAGEYFVVLNWEAKGHLPFGWEVTNDDNPTTSTTGFTYSLSSSEKNYRSYPGMKKGSLYRVEFAARIDPRIQPGRIVYRTLTIDLRGLP